MKCGSMQIKRIHLIWKCFTLDLIMAVTGRQSYYSKNFFLTVNPYIISRLNSKNFLNLCS